MIQATDDRDFPPIFRDYSLEYLRKTLDYRMTTLVDMMYNPSKITNRFRHNACLLLRKTEAELFGEEKK